MTRSSPPRTRLVAAADDVSLLSVNTSSAYGSGAGGGGGGRLLSPRAHAFPAAAEGCIRVDLRPAADGTSVLTVADDGAGFPAGTDFRNTHSFGLQLVNTLVEQLDGEIALTAVAGTTFTVRFPTAKGPPPDRTPAP